MRPSELEALIFRKRELTSKCLHWENQERIAKKHLEKIRVETEVLEKEIGKLKGESER
tara:strand:+ start:348 stop:521 length:174 start_codon:yes stop_codon:yes gene_type:complete